MTTQPWYVLEDHASIDTPALVVFADRVKANIERVIASVDRIDRLRPHVKTHKSPEVTAMFIARGITRFKCATIAEAEMLAEAGAKDIVLAYQPVGPKASRFAALVQGYPDVVFACLIDDAGAAADISSAGAEAGIEINYYIDLNVGMNRTGVNPDDAIPLYEKLREMSNLTLHGVHAYDGHIRDNDYETRVARCNASFDAVEKLVRDLTELFNLNLKIVAGGTPTFPIHAMRKDVECSPGTFVYWDKGYENILREQTYLHAAIVMTRVISRPAADLICVDLGHKSIASENPLEQRVSFLNGGTLTPVGHSEEHMVLRCNDASFEVGDVLYGVPYHVCPTIALFERVLVAGENRITNQWLTLSRNRKINI